MDGTHGNNSKNTNLQLPFHSPYDLAPVSRD